ncbi:MAG: hypothetical protein ACREBZ_07950, partial [Thermoplasmata archaeon]
MDSRSPSATLRVLGGAILAAAATIVAAYTLARGEGWAADGIAEFRVLLRMADRSLVSGSYRAFPAHLGGWLHRGLVFVYTLAAHGVDWLRRPLTRFT